jgi:hypothetical protein
MGDDRRTSVVDPWGVTHDVPNLAVIDGSVFVTAGAVNPTSTIAALALRSVEHMIETKRWVATPERSRPVSVPRTPPRSSVIQGTRESPIRLLSHDERSRFAVLADFLIPSGDGMPAATAVGIEGDLVNWVLRARPDLREPLRRGVRRLPLRDGSIGGALNDLRADDRDAYDALLLAVVAGYYHHPNVRSLIGYPGQVARPVRALEFPEYLEEGLLDSVLSM